MTTPAEPQPVAVVPVPSQHEVVPVEQAAPAEQGGQVTVVNQPGSEGDTTVNPSPAPAEAPAE